MLDETVALLLRYIKMRGEAAFAHVFGCTAVYQLAMQSHFIARKLSSAPYTFVTIHFYV